MSKPPDTGKDTGKTGLPRPFTQAEMDQIRASLISNGAPAGNQPTSLANCLQNGGHGMDAKGKLLLTGIYYPCASFNYLTGEWEKGPAVCSVCGTIGVEES